MDLSAYGISITVPDQWDAVIYERDGGNPVLHAANFPIDREDGDFASTSADTMPDNGLLIVLFEYDGSQASAALFTGEGLDSPLSLSEFSPGGARRLVPGLTGAQRFFVAEGRPFTLYVVLGPSGAVALDEANQTLASVVLQPAVNSTS